MLVHVKTILKDAAVKDYAVGAFSTTNLEMTLGIVRAAVAVKSPVIIQISEAAIKYAGLAPLVNLVQHVAQGEGGPVPVALHLEHGRSFGSVSAAVEANFSSVMINQAELPFDENVILTKKSVDFAHKHDVWAQGQLGVIPGGEGENNVPSRKAELTSPKLAAEFVEQTKVDGLSVSFGNVRGLDKLKQQPDLDFDLLKAIGDAVSVPLVLQGASLMKDKLIEQSVSRGIKIVSYNTDLRRAFAKALQSSVANKNNIDTREILRPAITAVERVVSDKLKLLGSESKA